MLRLPFARGPKAILPEAGQPGVPPFRTSPKRVGERKREMESKNPLLRSKKSFKPLKCEAVDIEQSASTARPVIASLLR
jgi:hypothetical protein